MNIIVLRVEDKELPQVESALRAAGLNIRGLNIQPQNQTLFGRLPFTSVATAAQRIEHREAQCEMFGALRAAGLDTSDREAMIAAINFFLGIDVTSRTQLTPDEMRAVTHAAACGFWRQGWKPRRCA